jgi:hypothetical protein
MGGGGSPEVPTWLSRPPPPGCSMLYHLPTSLPNKTLRGLLSSHALLRNACSCFLGKGRQGPHVDNGRTLSLLSKLKMHGPPDGRNPGTSMQLAFNTACIAQEVQLSLSRSLSVRVCVSLSFDRPSQIPLHPYRGKAPFFSCPCHCPKESPEAHGCRKMAQYLHQSHGDRHF